MQNEFVIRSFENCPGNQPLKFFFETNETATVSKQLLVSGHLDVTKEVKGPMELTVELNKCDMSLKKCEKFTTLKVSKLCHRIFDKKNFLHGILSTLQPQISCPVSPQRYVTLSSTLDLTAITLLPISGAVWMGNLKIMSGEGKKAELVFCANAETQIERVRNKKRN